MDKRFYGYGLISRTAHAPFYKSLQKSRQEESVDFAPSFHEVTVSPSFKKRCVEYIADFERKYEETLQEKALQDRKLQQNFHALQKQQQLFEDFKKSHERSTENDRFAEFLRQSRKLDSERSGQQRLILEYCDRLHDEVSKSSDVSKEVKVREEMIRNLLNKEVLPVASKLRKLSVSEPEPICAEEQNWSKALDALSSELTSFSKNIEMRKKRMEKALDSVESDALEMVENEKKTRKKMTAKLSNLIDDATLKIDSFRGKNL